MIKAFELKLKNGNSHPIKSVNLFIGPNNSGKSKLLKELRAKNAEDVVVEQLKFEAVTELAAIQDVMDKSENYALPSVGGVFGYACENWETAEQHIAKDIAAYGAAIYQREYAKESVLLDGKTRLGIVNDQSYAGASAEPKNVFCKLHRETQLKECLQENIKPAFGNKYFCLWNATQGKLKAYFSSTKPQNDIEHFDGEKARDFFSSCTALVDYSDGVKAYIGILVTIIGEDNPVFFIDEPEAFLHPSLSYELGKTIAAICEKDGKTCFIATHSPHFVKGCLSTYPESSSITRLEYTNEVSSSQSLDSVNILSIIKDPLLSNMGVTEALFHTRVVIVEGDSDRAFYNEINNRMLRAGKGGISNCLFINAQNKQTIATILSLLRDLGISCAAITDIDVLKEGGSVYAKIVSALKPPTKVFEDLRTKVHGDLTKAVAQPESEKITFEKIEEIVKLVRESDSGSPEEIVRKIKSAQRKRDYKKEGGVTLLAGQERADADYLLSEHAKYGWFIIADGELETWLKSLNVQAKKERWLSAIFQKMGSDPSDANYIEPPEDLDDVWLFINSIKNWFNKTN